MQKKPTYESSFNHAQKEQESQMLVEEGAFSAFGFNPFDVTVENDEKLKK